MFQSNEDYTSISYKGVDYKFYTTPTLPGLINEIFNDNYKIFERGVQLLHDDVVVDIGANEGIFSIMLAKMFPGIKVIACEPVPRTFFHMLRNVGLNGVSNIVTHNCGVGKEDGMIPMVVNDEFSGGSSGVQQIFDKSKNRTVQVDILSLDKYLMKYCMAGEKRIKLMKMDIEGMEYDALYNSCMLDKVDYFVGEFHINKFLIGKGRDAKELATYVGSKTNLLFYETCYMAE